MTTEETCFVPRPALTRDGRRESSLSSLYIAENMDVELYPKFLARLTL